MHKIAIFCTLTILVGHSLLHKMHAQTSTLPLHFEQINDANGLFLDVENLNFFSNNEYNSNTIPGYTLMGSWVSTSLKYKFSEVLTLEGGVHFKRFFGADSMENRSPFFLRAAFTPIPALIIIFGELDHHYAWGTPRQLYDTENLFTHPRKEGLQIRFNEGVFSAETWINWQKFIYSGSPFREEFTAGLNAQATLLKRNMWTLTLPVNYIAKHLGGEIDSEERLAETISNNAVGISLQKQFKGASLKSLGINLTSFFYSRSQHSDFTPYDKGYALYPELHAHIKKSSISLGYWYAENYAAFWGDRIYSNYLSEITYPERSLIDFGYSWDYHWSDNLYFAFKTRVYYDYRTKNIDLRAGIILHIKKAFELKKICSCH